MEGGQKEGPVNDPLPYPSPLAGGRVLIGTRVSI
jgi:hypothetical protein